MKKGTYTNMKPSSCIWASTALSQWRTSITKRSSMTLNIKVCVHDLYSCFLTLNAIFLRLSWSLVYPQIIRKRTKETCQGWDHSTLDCPTQSSVTLHLHVLQQPERGWTKSLSDPGTSHGEADPWPHNLCDGSNNRWTLNQVSCCGNRRKDLPKCWLK